MSDADVVIIGGGIGGLTLALALHDLGIGCHIYEAAPEIRAVGVGINLLPHAMKELARLGLLDALAAVAIETKEASFYNRFGQHISSEPLGRFAGYPWPQLSIHRGDLHLVLLAAVAIETKEASFYNRFGQHIYSEPLGKAAGYPWPQLSIHRGDLQLVLLDAVRARIDPARIHVNRRAVSVDQDDAGVTLHVTDGTGTPLDDVRGAVAIACDGINSVVREQFYPNEPEPRYSGVTMWRGVTRMKPVLSGATFVRAGWLNPGKLVMYPIRNAIDADGNQLMNWLAENETPQRVARDWTKKGRLEDFIGPYEDWHFEWCDVPTMFRNADQILEYPMVDQDPLDRWTFGRITLLGDAAHPMVPRGSNGAGQAILDARVLADLLGEGADWPGALEAYDRVRVPATANVVLTNRTNPPDAILRLIYERTGDRPFGSIDDVATPAELVAITDHYKKVAGYDPAMLSSA